MAVHIARCGHEVMIVSRRAVHMEALEQERENIDYLPGVKLAKEILIGRSVGEGIDFADVVFMACPSYGLRKLCEQIKKLPGKQNSGQVYITLCKGLERGTNLAPVEVLQSALENERCGVLSGPNFAAEIAQRKPAASTLAITERKGTDEVMKSIQKALSNDLFRIYTSKDVKGVEIAGCLKNIYAIGAGICDGLGLGDNAKAAYLTRALNELVRIGKHLGGQTETFYGLSGFGDLVATCSGKGSRNRTFGEGLANGKSAKETVQGQKSVVEGYWATHCFKEVLAKDGIEAPILSEIYSVLYDSKDSKKALLDLMTRELKTEVIVNSCTLVH